MDVNSPPPVQTRINVFGISEKNKSANPKNEPDTIRRWSPANKSVSREKQLWPFAVCSGDDNRQLRSLQGEGGHVAANDNGTGS